MIANGYPGDRFPPSARPVGAAVPIKRLSVLTEIVRLLMRARTVAPGAAIVRKSRKTGHPRGFGGALKPSKMASCAPRVEHLCLLLTHISPQYPQGPVRTVNTSSRSCTSTETGSCHKRIVIVYGLCTCSVSQWTSDSAKVGAREPEDQVTARHVPRTVECVAVSCAALRGSMHGQGCRALGVKL